MTRSELEQAIVEAEGIYEEAASILSSLKEQYDAEDWDDEEEDECE